MQSMTVQELVVLANAFLAFGNQRTDAGAEGEVNFYKSGSTIVMQMYDAEAAAWRAVTLS